MKKLFLLGILSSMALVNFAWAATLPFIESERQTYLENVIRAFHDTQEKSINELYQFVDLSEKQKCRSFFESVTLGCLHREIQKNCETGASRVIRDCAVLSDVILVNKMNEDRFLSKEARFDISKNSSNFQIGFAKALNTKYGFLTTQMLLLSKNHCLDPDAHCLAKEIDQYCLANSDPKGLPWQACTGAILWFVGHP